MAVVSVKEEWKELEAEFGQEQASAVRKYTVQFDTADNPVERPILARTANDGTTRIPLLWEIHPFRPWLFVSDVRPRAVGPFLFEVLVQYSTIPLTKRDEESEPTGSPLDQPPEIEWSFDVFDQQIDTDVNGNPITNSSMESFDPAPVIQVADLVLRVTRNRASYDPLLAVSYFNAVNSDYFLGFEPGTAKCLNWSGKSARMGNLFYWVVNYQINFRYGWWNEATQEYAKWRLRFRDEGFSQWNSTTGKYELILMGGEKISEPWPLNGQGVALTDQQKKDGLCYFRLYDVCKAKPFSVLGF